MNVLDIAQGSAQWFEERIGKVTASKVSAVLAKIKTGEAASRRNLRFEMVAEILTGRPAEHYVSEYMEQGIENEPLARTAYELATNRYVEQVGLVLHPTMARAAASPDGLVKPDGLIEIKCPKTETHIGYMMAGAVPSEYKPQMHWQMACCGPERKWNDFVSYDPRLPEEFQLFVCRLERDDKVIAEMEAQVEAFLAEVDAMILLLKDPKRRNQEWLLEASIAQARLEKQRK